MIKKLRYRLIATSMLSLFLVLTVIMGAVNILNYRQAIAQADSILEVLAANDGHFPRDSKLGPAERESPGGIITPETPYESRYFSVIMNPSGGVLTVDTGNIAAIDTSDAISYAERVWEKGRQTGFIGNYRYLQSSREQSTLLIFLDCGRTLSTCRTFLLISCGGALLGMLAVFALLLLLSGRIVRPISQSYEKQRRFITDAGHDLKTPLTIINADAEVLMLEYGENEWIRDIQTQSGRLTSLTEDLIALSRLEEDLPIEMAVFSLSQAVEEAAQPFASLAITQNKAFSLRITPGITLRGNEKSLRQLASILLDNALKYSDEGGQVSLSLDCAGKFARLTVRNTTDAPLPENLELLFDRFYRGDPSRNSQTGGHGIGLSIVKAVVAAHKGKLEAVCRDGKTLEISVLLPN